MVQAWTIHFGIWRIWEGPGVALGRLWEGSGRGFGGCGGSGGSGGGREGLFSKSGVPPTRNAKVVSKC